VGEGREHGLQVHFGGKMRLEFHGATITSDAGILAYRELDDALGLTGIAESDLHNVRFDKRPSIRLEPSSGNRYPVGLPDTRIRMTPIALLSTPRCARWLAVDQLTTTQPR
jgi:hypothetical protein